MIVIPPPAMVAVFWGYLEKEMGEARRRKLAGEYPEQTPRPARTDPERDARRVEKLKRLAVLQAISHAKPWQAEALERNDDSDIYVMALNDITEDAERRLAIYLRE